MEGDAAVEVYIGAWVGPDATGRYTATLAGPEGYRAEVWAWSAAASTPDGNVYPTEPVTFGPGGGRVELGISLADLGPGPATLLADVFAAGAPRDPRAPDAAGERSRLSIIVPPPGPGPEPEPTDADVPGRYPSVAAAIAAGDRDITVAAGSVLRSGTIRLPDDAITIRAVGTGDRPRLVITSGHGIARERGDRGSSPDVDLVGLDLVPEGRTATDQRIGVVVRVANGGRVRMVDCRAVGWFFGVSLEGVTEGGAIAAAELERNIIADSYSSWNAGHSSGVYLHRVARVSLVDNVFDHNGWNPDVARAGRTIFNHNVYIQGTCRNVTASGNLFSRGSSHGLQARPGGEVRDNLFYRNALAAFTGPLAPTVFERNLVAFADDIKPSDPALRRGFGLEMKSSAHTIARGNVFAYPETVNASSPALTFSRVARDRDEDPNYYGGPWLATVADNVLVGWPTASLITTPDRMLSPLPEVRESGTVVRPGDDAHRARVWEAIEAAVAAARDRRLGEPFDGAAAVAALRDLAARP